MRISDWSSDVCSSDLVDLRRGVGRLLCRGRSGLASRPGDSRAWRLPTANGLPIPNSGKDMDSLMDLTGKIALVTGAGQGVGRATALLFAQAGASVVVNDFHIDRAKAVADEIEAFGGVAMARQADITNLASVEAMTSEAIARFGRIDILVNNAGNAGPSDPNISPKHFSETYPAEWAPT